MSIGDFLNPFAPIIDIAGKVLDRVIPDKAAAEKAKQEFAAAALSQEFQIALAQVKVNEQEAKSVNWFVAGGRPFVMWICGVALAYAAIFEPILRFLVSVGFGYVGSFPILDTTLTMQVLFGILGLGGLRTFEKFKNTEGNR